MSRASRDLAEGFEKELKAVGRRARRRREALDMGVVEVAEKAGLSHSWVSRVERGLVPRPTLPELACLAKALGLPPQALLYGEMTEDDDAEIRRLLRNPELRTHFAAIADGVEWLHPDDQKLILATLSALASRAQAATLAGNRE